MAAPARIGVITNPNSRHNRLDPLRYDKIRECVGDLGLVRRTHHTGEIADVVREFLDLGVPWWVADGGDGAFHWLVNVLQPILRERGGQDPLPAVMPTNAGTINFLGVKAGVRGSALPLIGALCDTLRASREPEVVTLDSLELHGRFGADSDFPDRPFVKIGFASALAGLGQRAFDKFYAQEQQDALGVAGVAVKALLSAASKGPVLRHVPLPIAWRHFSDSVFEPQPLDVWVDGKLLPMRHYRAVNAGAIDINIAGVFRFFPFARERGSMHVMAGNPSPKDVLFNLPRMASGAQFAIPEFWEGPAKTLKVVARDGVHIDPVIDGELYWGLDEIEVGLGPQVRVASVAAR
jgi:hypothetical protein